MIHEFISQIGFINLTPGEGLMLLIGGSLTPITLILSDTETMRRQSLRTLKQIHCKGLLI